LASITRPEIDAPLGERLARQVALLEQAVGDQRLRLTSSGLPSKDDTAA